MRDLRLCACDQLADAVRISSLLGDRQSGLTLKIGEWYGDFLGQ